MVPNSCTIRSIIATTWSSWDTSASYAIARTPNPEISSTTCSASPRPAT